MHASHMHPLLGSNGDVNARSAMDLGKLLAIVVLGSVQVWSAIARLCRQHVRATNECYKVLGAQQWQAGFLGRYVMQPPTYWLQVIEGVTRVLGRSIWNGAAIGLTHGRLTSLPGGMAYRAGHVLVRSLFLSKLGA